jgi:hypothetical protein
LADFVPIVQGLGGNKTCDLCGKPVSLGDTTKQTNMAADGITLTSQPPMHMHSGCLRETLLWASKERAKPATVVKDIVRDDAGNITQVVERVPGVSELSARPLPVKDMPPEVK